MPYLDAPSPARYLSTRLGRYGTPLHGRLGEGVAFSAPHVFTTAQTSTAGKAKAASQPAKPVPAQKPVNVVPITSVPFLLPPGLKVFGGGGPPVPKPPVLTPPTTVNLGPTTPPPGGNPQGQVPNGPSNLPPALQPGGPGLMTDSGGGPVAMPPGGFQATASSDGSGDTATAAFFGLPWWAWLGLGVAGYFVVRQVTA